VLRKSVNDLRKQEIAESGSGQGQASDFVSHPLSSEKATVEQQEHMESLARIAARIISQSEQKAHEILEQAKMKAEAEAATIIAQSEKKAQEFVEEAQKQAKPEIAKVIAQSEHKARDIIQEAERQANGIRDEARKKADAKAAQIIADSEHRAKEFLEAARKKASVEAAKIITQSVQRIRKIVEGVEEMPQVAADEELEPTSSIPVEEAVKIEATTEEPEPTPPIPIEEAVKIEAAKEEPEPEVESGPELYQGRVALIVAPPIDFIQLRKLRASLLNSCPELQVLAMGGSAEGPTRIFVKLKKAIPLAEMIRGMPMVKVVVEQRQSSSYPLAGLLVMTQDEHPTLQVEHRILVVLEGK
jgi:vacuolar-type H+-ATPase subunit H